jgi:alkylation response protein AidB-like acyl-CoA dehydrogenase
MDMQYLYFNEDHEGLRKMARDFAAKSLAPIAEEVDKSDTFPHQVVEMMAEMGFMGLKIPEAYGGCGLDTRSYVCVLEEIAKKNAAATTFISSANALSSMPILLFGSEQQKQRYLPGIASGKSIVAFALTEPNAGSDAASITTKAVKDGSDYILNGRKCFITLAPLADHIVVFAKTSPQKGAKGITAFIVDMKLPGASVGAPEEKMGQRGVAVSDVLLEDVRVPADCILGEVDNGFLNAMKTLSI